MTVETNWGILKTDNEGTHALMCLRTPTGDEEIIITEAAIMEFLHEQGILYGISNVAIQALINSAMYDQFVCVAQGIKPLRGLDGHFEYQKDTNDMRKKPIIHEDGTADYKNSLTLATISEGELLAVYIPPTDGTDGMNIYGDILPSPGRGKDIPPLRGRGIVSDDSKQNFYASYSGHIVMDGSKIYIDKLYRVEGNLDIEVGNIIFDGDVEVMGDVRSGLSIDSKGSIFIHGHVGACMLTATHSITIEKGIQGRNNCVITAGEDISCKFIELATLKADGNIYADSVLYSNLVAKKQILITSKNGNVVSSELYGMQGVTVKEAGNSAGAPTLLRTGLPREDYTRAAELTKAIYEIDKKIEAFNQHLAELDNPSKEISSEKATEIRTQIMRAKIVLASTKTEHSEELSVINERINADKESSIINITGTVYEGVRIYIGAFPFIVTEAIREITFTVQGSNVIAKPLVQ